MTIKAMIDDKYNFIFSCEKYQDDKSFDIFNAEIQRRASFHINKGYKIFTTNADPEKLWNAYLSGFPSAEIMQHHNCNDCRHFIKKYGGLVAIDKNGCQFPLFWSNMTDDSIFNESKLKLYNIVKNARITGVFFPKNEILGVKPKNGKNHFLIKLPRNYVANLVMKLIISAL